jgi:hypothetical protein
LTARPVGFRWLGQNEPQVYDKASFFLSKLTLRTKNFVATLFRFVPWQYSFLILSGAELISYFIRVDTYRETVLTVHTGFVSQYVYTYVPFINVTVGYGWSEQGQRSEQCQTSEQGQTSEVRTRSEQGQNQVRTIYYLHLLPNSIIGDAYARFYPGGY